MKTGIVFLENRRSKMPQVKVSGVPYTINMTPNFNTIQDSINYYEEQLRLLKMEIKALKARNETLTEECCWLESLTRKIRD